MELAFYLFLIFTCALAIDSRHPQSAKENYSSSVKRTKHCPNGSELIGKQCVSSEVTEPQVVCPPSTTILNGECVSFARANKVCPQGSVLLGDRCVTTEVVPASFLCDQGEINGQRCIVTSQSSPVCPADLQLRDGKCVRFTPQRPVCAPGYQLQGKKCSKQISLPASSVCPSDFSPSGVDKCTKSVPVPPRCSAGFSLVNNECVKNVPRVAAPCPQGFTPNSTGCRRSRESPVTLICQSGFTLDSNNQCIQEVPMPPTCPAGTSRGSSGKCQRSVPKRSVCDLEEELIGGYCRRSSLIASELHCAIGYDLIHNQCKNVSVESPVNRCSSGVLKGNECVTESSSVPLIQCASGYQLAKGPKCIRKVPYDCPKTVVKTKCRMPAFVSDIGSFRTLNADYKTKSVPRISYETDKATPNQVTESKTPNCVPVKEVIPQTCTKFESTAVHYVCADGSAPIGKNCPIIASHPAEPYCRAGQLDEATGQCIKISTQSPNRVCSIGHLQTDGNCLQVDEKPARLICPEGSEVTEGKDGHCTIAQAEVNHPNRVIRQPPEEICFIGVKQGKICVEVEKVPRQMICPAGSEDRDDKCVLTTPVVIPEPVVITRPVQYTCEDGTTARDKLCFRHDTIPAEYTCADGNIKEGSRCVYTAELIYPPPRVTHSAARAVCPHGYQQRGDHCSLTSSQPVDFVCPPDFILNDYGTGKCVRSHDWVTTCPTGTQRTAAGCVRKSYAPPRVVEVKVCTKGQTGC